MGLQRITSSKAASLSLSLCAGYCVDRQLSIWCQKCVANCSATVRYEAWGWGGMAMSGMKCGAGGGGMAMSGMKRGAGNVGYEAWGWGGWQCWV